ncbi:MAG: hypothetical protein ACKVQK_08440 [Burkholderiales bacterium]
MIDTTDLDDTEISGKAGVLLDAPMSPLLEETAERKLFADLYSPTWVENNLAEHLFSGFFSSTSTEQPTFISNVGLGESSGEGWSTPISTDRFARNQHRQSFREEESADEDQHLRAIEDRVRLLARKYVAKEKFSNEESARLAIVTERVRKLLPAVTAYEFELLETALTSLQDISQSNASLQERLSLLRHRNA